MSEEIAFRVVGAPYPGPPSTPPPVERPMMRGPLIHRGGLLTGFLRAVERAAWRIAVVAGLWLAMNAIVFGVWSTGH